VDPAGVGRGPRSFSLRVLVGGHAKAVQRFFTTTVVEVHERACAPRRNVPDNVQLPSRSAVPRPPMLGAKGVNGNAFMNALISFTKDGALSGRRAM
jgi:hypothetical protein